MADVTMGRGALLTVDLVLPRGADVEYPFRYSTRASADAEKVPVDLTGWSARAQLRRRANDSESVPWLTLSSPADIVLGSDGTIRVVIAAAATEDAAWNARESGVWDLELTSPAGKVLRFVQGAVRVSQDVTRDG